MSCMVPDCTLSAFCWLLLLDGSKAFNRKNTPLVYAEADTHCDTNCDTPADVVSLSILPAPAGRI